MLLAHPTTGCANALRTCTSPSVDSGVRDHLPGSTPSWQAGRGVQAPDGV